MSPLQGESPKLSHDLPPPRRTPSLHLGLAVFVSRETEYAVRFCGCALRPTSCAVLVRVLVSATPSPSGLKAFRGVGLAAHVIVSAPFPCSPRSPFTRSSSCLVWCALIVPAGCRKPLVSLANHWLHLPPSAAPPGVLRPMRTRRPSGSCRDSGRDRRSSADTQCLV